MGSAADIDRLIDEGLHRYGTGDLDGALLAWEEALAIDPENAQANSYVDYVRLNYEVLAEAAPGVSVEDGFGIEEEPEYVIEIGPGDAGPGAPMYLDRVAGIDPLDEGWFIDEEATRDLDRTRTPPRTRAVPLELELEADEPPPPEGVSFEDATREYTNTREPPPNEFVDESSFRAEATPLGFGTQETEVKKRELGFVQPTHGSARLEIRVRTPSTAPKPQEPPAGPPPLELDLEPPEPTDPDLLQTTRGMAPITRPPAAVAERTTRDLPEPSRAPAAHNNEPGPEGRDRTATQPSSPAALGLPLDEPAVASAPTRDLGTRPANRPPSVYPEEDAPTRQSDARAIRAAAAAKQPKIDDGTRQDIVLPFDPIDARTAQILDEIDAETPPDELKEDRTRRRITTLLERAVAWNSQEELDKAVAAVDLALSEDPNTALAQKLIHRNRDAIMTVFQNFLGDLERQPQLARPLHELASAPISPRAAFLLSRIDGTLTIDEILDVSGMPRLEAYRHLCQLFLRGILR